MSLQRSYNVSLYFTTTGKFSPVFFGNLRFRQRFVQASAESEVRASNWSFLRNPRCQHLSRQSSIIHSADMSSPLQLPSGYIRVDRAEIELFNKSVVDIRCLYVCRRLTRHIALTHLAKKAGSLLNCFSVRHQHSAP